MMEVFPSESLKEKMGELANEVPVPNKEILRLVSAELSARAIKEAWINQVDEEYSE